MDVSDPAIAGAGRLDSCKEPTSTKISELYTSCSACDTAEVFDATNFWADSAFLSFGARSKSSSTSPYRNFDTKKTIAGQLASLKR